MSVSFVKAAKIQEVAVKSGDYLKELLSMGLWGRSKKEAVILTLKEEVLKITYEAEEKMLIFYQHGFIDRNISGLSRIAAKTQQTVIFLLLFCSNHTGPHEVVEMATYYINREFLLRCSFAKHKKDSYYFLIPYFAAFLMSVDW